MSFLIYNVTDILLKDYADHGTTNKEVYDNPKLLDDGG